jgi:hypothetical protein
MHRHLKIQKVDFACAKRTQNQLFKQVLRQDDAAQSAVLS